MDNKKDWFSMYKELEKSIENEKNTKVNNSVIEIPEEKRQAFYHLFDATREQFLIEEFPDEMQKAKRLSGSYTIKEEEIIKTLELEGVFMSIDVQRFLQKPSEQMRRELFELLFDLLIDNTTIENFANNSKEIIQIAFKKLYQQAFVKWIVLSILIHLEPSAIYRVPVTKLQSRKEVIKSTAKNKEVIPLPEKVRDISFEVGGNSILLVPDFIIYSKKLEKYVGIRTELGKAMRKANQGDDLRESYSISELLEKYGLVNVRPDILLYTGDNLETVSLVGDAARIFRPDLIIQCIEDNYSGELELKNKISESLFYKEVLKPKCGELIVSNIKGLENNPEIKDKDISILKTSFENDGLEMINKILTKN